MADVLEGSMMGSYFKCDFPNTAYIHEDDSGRREPRLFTASGYTPDLDHGRDGVFPIFTPSATAELWPVLHLHSVPEIST